MCPLLWEDVLSETDGLPVSELVMSISCPRHVLAANEVVVCRGEFQAFVDAAGVHPGPGNTQAQMHGTSAGSALCFAEQTLQKNVLPANSGPGSASPLVCSFILA